MTGATVMQWGRSYMVCKHEQCHNWIWEDKLKPGTRCRSCGTWWPNTTKATGKGKGQGHGNRKQDSSTWYRKATDGLIETPPGLKQLKLETTQESQKPAACSGRIVGHNMGCHPGRHPGQTRSTATRTRAHGLAEKSHVSIDVVTKLTQPCPDTAQRTLPRS